MMKKELVVSIIFVALLVIPFASADITINCSNGTKVDWDENDIELNDVDYISGLGIGLLESKEMRLISGGYRITAKVMVNSAFVSFSENGTDEEISLRDGEYTSRMQDATSKTAIITLGGNSKMLTENNLSELSGFDVLLIDADATQTAELLVGTDIIELSNDGNPWDKFTFRNNSYIVEIKSASESNAVIRVSICESDNIMAFEKEKPIVINQTNQTNQIVSNSTINNTEVKNESERQVTVAEIQENLRKMQEANKTAEDGSASSSDDKKGIFSKFFNWLRGLFT